MRALCGRFVAALRANDAEALRAVFAADAVVTSPLYGQAAAAELIPALINDTRQSEVRLLDVLASMDSGRRGAMRLGYAWTMTNEHRFETEAVHLFETEAGGQRIVRLTIVYDTAGVREAFEGLKGGWGGGDALDSSRRELTLHGLLEP